MFQLQIKAVLCAAMYPNIAVMDDSPGKLAKPNWHDGNSELSIHPSSINHALDAQQFRRPYLIYLEKVWLLLPSLIILLQVLNMLEKKRKSGRKRKKSLLQFSSLLLNFGEAEER